MAQEPPGEVFPWRKGWRLTAIDEAVIAVPAAVVAEDEPVETVIHCSEGVSLTLPSGPRSRPGAMILIVLQAGQSAWLSKSWQGLIIPQSNDDTRPRRFRLEEVTRVRA